MKSTILHRDVNLILAASFFYMASPMLVTPLITGFAGSIGVNAAMVGLVGGLMNLCSLLCRPFVGNLADKISKYRLTFIGAVLMLLACVGYMLATHPFLVILARIINGIGFACCSVCLSTWMSNLLPKEKIGSGMGLYGTMNALSMAIAPAIGVKVYQTFGYHSAFLIAALFMVFTTLLIQFVKDKGEAPQPKVAAAMTTDTAKTKHRLQVVDQNALPAALIIMLFAIPYCATQSFLISYTEAKDLSVSVSLFFPFYAAVLLVLRLSLRSQFDKQPFSVFLLASAVSAALGLIMLAIMQSNIGLILAAMFMAGGYGIMCSVCQSTAILAAGEEKRGLANSTYYVGIDLGMTLGPAIGGFLFGHLDIHLFYPALLLTVPLCFLVHGLSQRQKNKRMAHGQV